MDITKKNLISLFGLRRISVRLTLSYGFLLLLFILVVIQSLAQIKSMAVRSEEFARLDMQRLLDVQELSIAIEGSSGALLHLLTAEKEFRTPEYQAIDEKKIRIDQLMAALKTIFTEPEQRQRLANMVEKITVYQNIYLKTVDQLELDGLDVARRTFREEVEPCMRALLKESNILLQTEREQIRFRHMDEQQQLAKFKTTFTFSAGLIIILGSLFALLTYNGIVLPLSTLKTSALQIAEGDYKKKVPQLNMIEFERVGNALNTMAEAIATREREIEQLAYYDSLTELPNRTLLLKSHETINLQHMGLLLMDVARLKTVNETLGFSTGDTIIQETAKRLQKTLEDNVIDGFTLVKFSGGMFAILCRTATQESIRIIIATINAGLSEPIPCGAYSVDVNLICGIALCDDNTMTLNTLIRNAEVALYAAKAGTHAIVLYSDAHEASRLSHLNLLSDLRSAVNNSELQMWLQPKINLNTMQTYGFEALVRWQHLQRGFISPIEFIPFAERTGYIGQVTHWMLENAIQTLASWKNSSTPLHTMNCLSIAVNVSANDLRDQEFPERVRQLLKHYGVDPHLLQLELTESGIMEDPSSAISLLQHLRDIGVGLSIDDFGTGYSSLAYLQKLPVNELKIDRSFVMGIDQSPSTQRLVKTIIDMGHGLNLSVIAEGIETKEELNTLRQLHCDAMQGFFISKPLYGATLQDWLQNQIEAS